MRASVPRRFLLVRAEDVSGVSGLGVVAEGTLYTSGRCTLNWRSEVPSTGVYECLQDVITVHGHGGSTRVEFLDPES